MSGDRRNTTLVVGATGGIGSACVDALRAAGDGVITADLQGADVAVNLATADRRRQAVHELLQACPDGIDRLVMAAGVGPTVADAALIPAINLFGTLAVVDGLLGAMAGRTDASVVLLSSHSASMLPAEDETVTAFLQDDEAAAARAALATDPAVAYAASKRALTTRMRQRVQEFADAGIRLNAVAPGPVKTALLDATLASEAYAEVTRALPVPIGRWAEPAEIASVVAFLLSPAASIVHGSVWFTDGGTDALIRPGGF